MPSRNFWKNLFSAESSRGSIPGKHGSKQSTQRLGQEAESTQQSVFPQEAMSVSEFIESGEAADRSGC